MPFVCFRSTASESSGLYLLSNFAPTPFTLTWPVTLGEKDPAFPRFLLGRTCAYETSEHAYQATRRRTSRARSSLRWAAA